VSGACGRNLPSCQHRNILAAAANSIMLQDDLSCLGNPLSLLYSTRGWCFQITMLGID
jgi:hypothetical protein